MVEEVYKLVNGYSWAEDMVDKAVEAARHATHEYSELTEKITGLLTHVNNLEDRLTARIDARLDAFEKKMEPQDLRQNPQPTPTNAPATASFATGPLFAPAHKTQLTSRTAPSGAIVVPDPYEAYYRSLSPGQEPDPDRLMVATDSVAIRSVHALIDNSMKKECILDPGCQIIAMSEKACHEIGLAYDPAIRLNMQSANGEVNQSLGLSRNVSFRIGSITCYLQVHIIRTPAYDILLGRPFDILTESIVRNFSNEDQTITLCDPNTGQRITVPTFSKSNRTNQKKEDF